MDMYADYDFYRNSYHGSMSLEDFQKYGLLSQVFIDYITHDRINLGELADSTKEKVKLAMCAAADLYLAYQTMAGAGDGREIRTENNDGYSVSYVTEGRDGELQEDVLNRRLYAKIRPYLIHSGLLYTGVL